MNISIKALGLNSKLSPLSLVTALCVSILTWLIILGSARSVNNIIPVEYEPFPVNAAAATQSQLAKETVAILQAWIGEQVFYNDSHPYKVPDKYTLEYAEAISKSKYPFLCAAVFKIESRFNPFAISSAGAMGSAQVMPLHEKELVEANIIKELGDLFLIENSVMAFDFILQQKLKSDRSKGDLNKALSLYSGGAANYAEKVSTEVVKIYMYLMEERNE